MLRIPAASGDLQVIARVSHKGRRPNRKLMVTGIHPRTVFPLHADVGRACVVPLQHGTLCALYT